MGQQLNPFGWVVDRTAFGDVDPGSDDVDDD